MATFSLVLEDEDLAAWAAVNNCFPHKKGYATGPGKYWNGVLFYLGSKRDIATGARKHILHSNRAVVIEDAVGNALETFSATKIRETSCWINIIAANPNGASPPMTVQDYLQLYPPLPPAEYFDRYPGGLISFWQPQEPGSKYTITATKIAKHDKYELSCETGAGFVVEIHQYDEDMKSLANAAKISVNASNNGGGPGDTINPVQRP